MIDDGGISSTSMVMVVVSLPPLLTAVTLYVVKALIIVGVPQIVPLLVPNDMPFGKEGEIDQLVTGSPFAVGVTELVIAVPMVKVNEFGVYVIEDGGASLTKISTLVVVCPPELIAVIV